MDKKVKDTFVGIFIVISVVLFIILYTWLTGRISMRNTHDVKVYYQDVGGLRVGDPVLVYGIEKGKIKSINLESNQVAVIVSVSKDIPLPDDSKFSIRSVSYLGGDKYIKITPGKSGAIGTTFSGTSESFDLESMASDFSKAIKAIESFKMPDFSDVGTKLSVAIDKNINSLAQMIQQPSGKLNLLVEELDSLLVLIQGDGTVGKLIRSDELYDEIRETNKSIKELVDDLKTNPKKYINLKDIKIF